jgi:hypothetical protein
MVVAARVSLTGRWEHKCRGRCEGLTAKPEMTVSRLSVVVVGFVVM